MYAYAFELLGFGPPLTSGSLSKRFFDKLKKDVSLMRSLQSKVSQIASQSDDVAIKALAEEFRYSDPVSNDAIADAEADLAAAVDQLQAAFVDGISIEGCAEDFFRAFGKRPSGMFEHF